MNVRNVLCAAALWHTLIGLAQAASAAESAPAGREYAGVFYAITHLHPAAYCVLTIIVLLSAANLFFGDSYLPLRGTAGARRGAQGRRQADRQARSGGAAPGAPRVHAGEVRASSGAPSLRPPRDVRAAPYDEYAHRQVRRVHGGAAHRPTPLDGLNHPIAPLLGKRPPDSPSGAQGPSSQNTAPAATLPAEVAPSFRFRSAVAPPTDEELERRERERLSVSGRVVDQKGKGVSSALVYLADEAGNRVGQPCRTADETGDFTVRVLAPGKYSLHAYKRGYLAAEPQPSFLPAEKGTLEGVLFRLAPQGCMIKGKVVFQDQSDLRAEVKIIAVAEAGEPLTAQAGLDGVFTVYGAAADSEYTLRVQSPSGELLAESEPIRTERARELYCEIPVPLVQATASGPDSSHPESFPWPTSPTKEAGAATHENDTAAADAARRSP